MITAFAGSKAAEGFLLKVNWRWGFGCFAIIVPVVTFPLFMLLKVNLHKAERQGLIIREKSGQPLKQRLWHGIVQFDGNYPTRLFLAKANAVD